MDRMVIWIAALGVVGPAVLVTVAAWAYSLGRSHGIRRARAVAYAVSGQGGRLESRDRTTWVACGDAIITALDKEG